MIEREKHTLSEQHLHLDRVIIELKDKTAAFEGSEFVVGHCLITHQIVFMALMEQRQWRFKI